MKKLDKKQIRNIEFQKLQIGKEPIVIEYDTALSANKQIYENIYDVSASGISGLQDIVYNGLEYCNERLSGVYNFSGDKTYETAPVNILQENKTILKNYMLKYYLMWNEGDLKTWEGFNISGLSGIDYSFIYKIIENKTELIEEIKEDIKSNKVSEIKKEDDIEYEYQQFITQLKRDLYKKSLTPEQLFDVEYNEFIEKLKNNIYNKTTGEK